MESKLRVIDLCAGAGGQARGLELAGFDHELAIELDTNATNTLRHNRPEWQVLQGDVAGSAYGDLLSTPPLAALRQFNC